MNKYIGVKLIDAEETICCNKEFFDDMQKAMEYRSEVFNKTGKVYDIQQGYKVIYPDGYVSFSPKEAFEAAYFQLNNEKADRITAEDVDNFVKDQVSIKIGTKTTNTTLTLLNDYEINGQASCVRPENYDIKIGESFAKEKAKDKIWELLSFVLQWGINGIKKDK